MDRDSFIPSSFLNSYAPLLYCALQDTDGLVVECGMGNYSTTLLHNTNRLVVSYDTNREWFEKFSVPTKQLVQGNEWRSIVRALKPIASVIFIDQAPGESREGCIAELSNDYNGIVVAHDTEPAADYGYKMRQHFNKYKYKVEVETSDAWATALSNTIDIRQWSGERFGDYLIR